MDSVFQSFPMLPGRRTQAWHYQPAYRRPRHFHEEPEINLITQGRGVIYIGEREIEVRPGGLVWFPPGLDHYLAAASDDFELLTAAFQPSLLDALRREHAVVANFARPYQQLDASQALEVATALGQAHEAVDAQSTEQRSLNVLRDLLRLNSGAAVRLGHRAASFIVAHPETSRDRLAKVVGSNRGDVSRQFHQDHGMTLRKYRNMLRTLAFLRLSQDNSASLTRAAIKAGFGSYSQCHRVFRSLMGLSPREFAAKRDRLQALDQFEPLDEFLATLGPGDQASVAEATQPNLSNRRL